jgi:CRP-like cAMP-binding protein
MRTIPCEQCSIRGRSLVAELPVDRLPAFRSSSVIASYRRRQVIFLEGTPATGLYFVCRGAVKVYQSERFGREHILAIAGPGDLLGELPLDPAEPYAASAEALTDTQLCFLPRERLADILELHPMVGTRLVAGLSKALAGARKKVRALALKPAVSRLAELLLQIGVPHDTPGPLALRYSRREIAEMIGVSTETAIRLLAQLKRQGVIQAQGRALVVADPERLRRLANRDSVSER